MAPPERLADGTLRVPARAESDGIVGDGVLELRPGDPDYDRWDAWLRGQESTVPRSQST